MSRSTFLTTNEIPTTTDRRYHHGLMTTNRSTETVPIVVQSSVIKTTNTSITRNNPKIKRNLRDKRRSTGIRPNDISLAEPSTDGSANEDDEKEEKPSTYITESNESFEHNRTIPPSKPVFTVNRVQSSFENLSIPRTETHVKTSSSSNIYSGSTTQNFQPEEFLRYRQTSDDDSSALKYRQFEERIRALESLIYDKDNIIYDLQRKLDNVTQNFADAEQQIYKLHQDKLTLIKAFSTLQDEKPPPRDLSKRSHFVTRN